MNKITKSTLTSFLAAALLIAAASTSAYSQTPEARPRVLILPFTTLNATDDQTWIAKAVQDNTVVVLSQAARFTPVAYSGDLKSPDPASAARLAKAANLPYAIYGSAQIVEKNVRLTAQLLDSSTGDILLTASSTGPLSSLLTLEDDLAQKLNTTAANPPAAKNPPQPDASQPPQKSVAVQSLEIEQLKRDLLRLAQQQAANTQALDSQTSYPQTTYGTTGSLPPDLSLVAQTNNANSYTPYYSPYYTPYYSYNYTPYYYSNLLSSGYYYPSCNYSNFPCYAGSPFYLNASIYGRNWSTYINVGNPCNTRYYTPYRNTCYTGGYSNFQNYCGVRTSLVSYPASSSISPTTPGIVNFNATTITRTNTPRR